jgi:hypothetical protein
LDATPVPRPFVVKPLSQVYVTEFGNTTVDAVEGEAFVTVAGVPQLTAVHDPATLWEPKVPVAVQERVYEAAPPAKPVSVCPVSQVKVTTVGNDTAEEVDGDPLEMVGGAPQVTGVHVPATDWAE